MKEDIIITKLEEYKMYLLKKIYVSIRKVTSKLYKHLRKWANVLILAALWPIVILITSPNNNNMKEIKPVAYSGKYVDFNNKTYFLIPEVSQGGCKGCDLIGKGECTKDLTDYCRQGFIFKRVKSYGN